MGTHLVVTVKACAVPRPGRTHDGRRAGPRVGGSVDMCCEKKRPVPEHGRRVASPSALGINAAERIPDFNKDQLLIAGTCILISDQQSFQST